MKKLSILLFWVFPFMAIPQAEFFKPVNLNGANWLDHESMDHSMAGVEEEPINREKKQGTVPGEPGNSIFKAQKDTSGELGPASFQSFSRYDFMAGENIVYAEDFMQDALGELPLKWSTNNRGETIIDNQKNKWMRLFPGSRFTSPGFKPLPKNFTIEMDILMQFNGEQGYVYPNFEIKILDLLPGESSARSYVMNEDAKNEVTMVLMPRGTGAPLDVQLRSYVNGREYFSNQQKEIKTTANNEGKPIHLSIWVQKERIRYWINGDKVFDIPQAVPAAAFFNRIGFNLESSLYEEDQLGIYVSNIKVAEGTPDMRNQLLAEGKLVTHGILFDVNSDKIKAESAGVLKEIATVLKENPSVKIKIVGHTDNDGDAVKNLELSRRRSLSVKNALYQAYGIDSNRMETEGMGEQSPVTENKTREGRAQNRRVEFIKL